MFDLVGPEEVSWSCISNTAPGNDVVIGRVLALPESQQSDSGMHLTFIKYHMPGSG